MDTTTTTTHDLGHDTSFLASPGVSLSVKLVCAGVCLNPILLFASSFILVLFCLICFVSSFISSPLIMYIVCSCVSSSSQLCHILLISPLCVRVSINSAFFPLCFVRLSAVLPCVC